LGSPRAADLAKEERGAITEASARLRVALVGADYKLIRNRIDELNHATTHLAEMLMNGALQTALEGKRLDEV
ncbi:MAG: molecular chaperone DnaK, partial [Candidatus Acidiferrales bacterium]